eukprot:7391397-Prymnesium_polylepis.1
MPYGVLPSSVLPCGVLPSGVLPSSLLSFDVLPFDILPLDALPSNVATFGCATPMLTQPIICHEAIDLSVKPCKIPIGWDSKTGAAVKWLGGENNRKRPGGRCQCCAVRAIRAGLTIRKNARWSRFACKYCRVILCDGCWDLWDHTNERAPLELPPAAAGDSRSAASPDASPGASAAAAPPSPPLCPEGHVMTTGTTRGGLMCDGCERDLHAEGESIFYSCSTCDSTMV